MSLTVCLRLFLLLPALLVLSGCFPAVRSQLDEEKEPHFLAGKNRTSTMDYRGAIESFRKALEVNPQSGSAHFELGWLFDQKESDPAAAIYHYQSYLQLRPNAENTEMVKTRIMACKQELARTVSLAPITQNWQKEFDALAEENRKLKSEVERLKAYAAQLQVLTNRSVPAAPVGTVYSGTPQAAAGHPLASTATADRTHVVRAGETPLTISRQYGIRLESLLSANPRLEPRRMRVGQTVKIPAK